jgi:glutamate dehydrogenase
VNIKILLNDCISSGEITEQQRNKLLTEMTEEVAKLVLQNNYRQVRTVTRAASQSLDYLSLYIRYIAEQEASGKINRQLEFLPDSKTLLERRAIGKGLTRPELSVLMAYSKILLKEEILKSDLVTDPYLSRYMAMAFPKRLSERFAAQMKNHRLRAEIISTQLSNSLVNDMGLTFVYQMKDETGATTVAIVQAYVIMRKVFDLPWLLTAVDALDEKAGANLELENIELDLMIEVMRLIRRAIRWLLRNRRAPYDVEKTIQYFSGHVEEIYRKLPELLVGTEKENFEQRTKTLIAVEMLPELAVKIASTRYIYSALNIIQIATDNNADIDEVATIYFILADRLELVWFREIINAYPVDSHWSVLARSAFKDELDMQHRALVVSVLRHKDKSKNVLVRINNWFKENEPLLRRWQEVVTQLRSSSGVDSAMLTVAVRELTELAELSAFQRLEET